MIEGLLGVDDRLLNAAHDRCLRYLRDLDRGPVFPNQQAISALSALDECLPENRTAPLETLALLDDVASPATVASAGRRYFGMVVGGSLPIALASDWLVSTWDQNAIMPTTSPAAAKIESVAGRWVREILGLPEDGITAFVTGASTGNLVAVGAARRYLLKRAGYDVDTRGLAGGPQLRIVAGAEVHSTVLKMLRFAGFGSSNIELVDVDDQGRIRTERLPKLDSCTLLLLQSGNVNSGASDPFSEIIPLAREAGAWVHVDGAFGLWAAASERHKWQVQGVHEADSWVIDAHKWLNVPYDSAMVICRQPEVLQQAMALSADYVPSGNDWTAKDTLLDFSRRARGVPVWAALRCLGREGVADLVDRCCVLARRLADGLEEAGFVIHNQIFLNQVVASIGDANFTNAVRQRVEASGTCWFGPTTWRGVSAVRFSISSWATTESDIDASLASIREAVDSVQSQ